MPLVRLSGGVRGGSAAAWWNAVRRLPHRYTLGGMDNAIGGDARRGRSTLPRRCQCGRRFRGPLESPLRLRPADELPARADATLRRSSNRPSEATRQMTRLSASVNSRRRSLVPSAGRSPSTSGSKIESTGTPRCAASVSTPAATCSIPPCQTYGPHQSGTATHRIQWSLPSIGASLPTSSYLP